MGAGRYSSPLGKAGIAKLADRMLRQHLPSSAVASLPRLDLTRARDVAIDCLGPGRGGYVHSADGPEIAVRMSEAEYLAVVDDLMLAMTERGCDQVIRDEVLAVVCSLRRDVVCAQ